MESYEEEKKAILSEWISSYSHMIVRLAFYYVKDPMIAEDIAQEVFIRAYRNMEGFRGESSVATWLKQITINACKDYKRSWSYKKLVFTNKDIERISNFSPEQQMLARIHENELLNKVMKLPIKYREVLVLHFYEELSTKEIAETLNINHSTVRVRIMRGLKKLKIEMAGGHEFENIRKSISRIQKEVL